LLIAFALFGLVIGGCARVSQQEQTTDDVDMSLVVMPDPPEVGAAMLVVTLTDAEGNPIDGASLDVKGDMNHAGMEPVLADVEGGEGGTYEVPFEWTMGGDWVVTVTATLPDERIVSRTFDLSVDSDGGMDMGDEMDMDEMDMGEDEMEMDEG
jgi:hypothetical protein